MASSSTNTPVSMENNSTGPGALSNISTSAASLLSLLTNHPPSSVTTSLASSSSSTKPRHPRDLSLSPAAQTSSGRIGDHIAARSCKPSYSTTNNLQEFRSQQPEQLHSSEAEFNLFATLPPNEPFIKKPVSTAALSDIDSPHRYAVEDGLEVVSILSKPVTSEIYHLDVELRGINIAHPTIRSFAVCNDPVEFLSTMNEYTEEVWGPFAEVVRQTREESLNDKKGKRKEANGGIATARLMMIWGHLKGVESSS